MAAAHVGDVGAVAMGGGLREDDESEDEGGRGELEEHDKEWGWRCSAARNLGKRESGCGPLKGLAK